MERFGRIGALSSAVIVGIGFGVIVRLGDGGPEVGAWLVNIAGPWLVVACLAGATTTSSKDAAQRAVALLVAAVVAKYAFQFAQHQIPLHNAARRIGGWGVAAVLTGVVFGPLGAALRREGSAWVMVLAGALAIEALAFLTGAIEGEGGWLRYHHQPAADMVFSAELALAALGLGWGLRSLLASREDR